MAKFRCTVCGYLYDETKGDKEHNITGKFSELPEDWVCPICGAAKSMFVKI